MKIPFRKNNRAFSEQIFKQSEQQKSVVGSEHKREYLIDGDGYQLLIKNEFSGLTRDPNGMPLLNTVRIGIIADCGHKISDLDSILGRCKNSHILCKNCQSNFFSCKKCGQFVCNRCVLILKNGDTVCKDHILTVLINGMLKILTETLIGLFGITADEQ